jgi:hypothetical protein
VVGTHRGLVKDASVQPPYRARYPSEEVIGGEGGRGHHEPSKSTPGFISESRNRNSANGSTLRRWIAATTPAAVRPSAWSFCKARRMGWSFSWFSRVAPSASYRRRRSPLVEKRAAAPRRQSGDKTTDCATPCSKTQGRQRCTVVRAPTSARGCSHRSAPPYGPSSRPSTRRRIPRRRDGSTGPSGGQSPKTPRKPPRNGRLRDGVGVEVVKLHPVVMWERRHPKPPLMKRGEADHIPRRRSRVGLAPEGQPLRLRPAGERTEQTLGDEGLQILHSDGGEGPRVTRWNDGRLVSHCRAEAMEAEGTRCAVFSSLCLLSQVVEAKAGGKRKWQGKEPLPAPLPRI